MSSELKKTFTPEEFAERIRNITNDLLGVASDLVKALSELCSDIQSVARHARIQDNLNKHGFDAIEKAITALSNPITEQPQPRKTPRKRQ